MVYTNVLSDLAIKKMFPEHFPLDLGSELENQTITLPTHPFKGIRRTLKRKTIARYPFYDFANRAMIIAPLRAHQTQFNLTMEYRKKLNSLNVPQNLEFGYSERLKPGYEPIHPLPPSKEDILNSMGQNTATIHLKKQTHDVVDKFNERNPQHINLISNKIKHTLYNVADEEDHEYLLRVGAKGVKATDEEFKLNLLTHYEGDEEAIANLQNAFNAATIEKNIY